MNIITVDLTTQHRILSWYPLIVDLTRGIQSAISADICPWYPLISLLIVMVSFIALVATDFNLPCFLYKSTCLSEGMESIKMILSSTIHCTGVS